MGILGLFFFHLIFIGSEQLSVLVCNAKVDADFDNEPPACRLLFHKKIKGKDSCWELPSLLCFTLTESWEPNYLPFLSNICPSNLCPEFCFS